MTRLSSILVVVGLCAFLSPDAMAQSSGGYTQNYLRNLTTTTSAARFTATNARNSVYNQSVPRFGFSDVNRNLFAPATGSLSAKPFSTIQSGPSVSPYLGLSDPFSNSATSYYTQIRPQQEQRRAEQQALRQQALKQRQLSTVAAQGPYDIKGSDKQAPTGHAAVFMNYGGYYPQLQQRPRR